MARKTNPDNAPIRLENARLVRDGRVLWDGLDLAVKAGEFIAVLGPNGAGKTSFLRVLLGLLPLSGGGVKIFDAPAARGDRRIGYIPQQKSFDAGVPIRGRDLVQFGITGYRYGFGASHPLVDNRVDEAIKTVGADAYADMPLGLLSGGEQQRLRVAQALVGRPDIVLCDEPLLSLDIASQKTITKLIDGYRRDHHASVVFVTHEFNSVLQYVDRILYLANGQWVVDTPGTVLQRTTLSKLYGTDVEVLKVKDRILVIGAEDVEAGRAGHHGVGK